MCYTDRETNYEVLKLIIVNANVQVLAIRCG